MKKIFLIPFLFLVVISVSAQDVIDGIYEKVTTIEKEIIPYDDIREADIFWSKRVWRTIDTREKMNLIFAYPQLPLSEIVHTAAVNGDLTAYTNHTGIASGQFLTEDIMATDKVGKIGNSIDTTWQINAITLEDEQVIVSNELEWDKIVKYKIKEDWFFDEETSTFQVRIIGVAPVLESFDEDGNFIGDETMYWIYYPDLRPILAKYEAYNPGNYAMRVSWEDIFEARLFSSYITEEDNVYDRPIQEYATALDALYESDKIKNDMFKFEHDLWSF